MTFFLREIEGKNIGEEYSLLPGDNLIGRSRTSNIRVYNEDVSGKHFILAVSDDGVILRNLSHYGTSLDGVIVQDSTEIQPGQKIRAGKSLCFELLQRDGSEEEQVLVTSEETSVTKFVSDIEQTNHADIEDPDASPTGVTKFSQDAPDADLPESETTGVTKIAADISPTPPVAAQAADDAASDVEDKTSVTKFSSDVPQAADDAASDVEDKTSVTKFSSDVPHAADVAASENAGQKPPETEDRTSVTQLVSGDASAGSASGQSAAANRTDVSANSPKSPQASDATKWEKTSIGETAIITAAADEKTHSIIDHTASQVTSLPDKTVINSPGGLESEKAGDENFLEEQGMFFEDETNDESVKTNANETQVVQTRMASADEMNFIKSQIKKQQQSRLFFKFLVFAFLAVCLVIIAMMKAPQKEKVLSWPHKKNGTQIQYLTTNIPAWEGYKNGAFDLYFPLWPKNKVASSGDTITIDTFLGKDGDVPLSIILQREDSLGHVYENRENALQGAKKRLSETPDEMFNFESNAVRTFLLPSGGQAENAIPCDVVLYHRGKGSSWFGMLRFFRYGRYNYILRTEVPASEKHRALPALTTDCFLDIHPRFVRSHWEGDDEYVKGDTERMLLGVRDELLNHNSPMQYPRLELAIKSILAQTCYHNHKKQYSEAMELLLQLREKQQQWYNGQRIRWAAAVRENNQAEKIKIRNESEAVFSITGDKRRYDILRDHWE